MDLEFFLGELDSLRDLLNGPGKQKLDALQAMMRHHFADWSQETGDNHHDEPRPPVEEPIDHPESKHKAKRQRK